jgi:hypothetical protein
VNQEAWPTPQESSREPLPRVEDLPVAEQGFDPDSVRAAFDSFYRHAAQLDAALRTLEAVDSFHRQAAALRADIRTLRTAGWTQQPWSATPAYGYTGRTARDGISPAVWRIAGEAAFLIVVAVVLGVAKLSWWLIVLVMAFAWLLVGLLEWAATRDRFAAPRSVDEPPLPVVEAAAPPARTEEEPSGWAAFEAPHEPSDAMTMIGAPPAVEEPVDEVAAAEDAAPEAGDAVPAEEPEPAVEAAVADAEEEPEPEPEPEDAAAEPPVAPERRRRWWKRRDDEEPVEAVQPPPPPRHVRVLAGDEYDERETARVDPWEAGFDADLAADDEPGQPAETDAAGERDEGTGEEAAALEPDEETGEDAAAVAGDVDDAARRRFRRR